MKKKLFILFNNNNYSQFYLVSTHFYDSLWNFKSTLIAKCLLLYTFQLLSLLVNIVIYDFVLQIYTLIDEKIDREDGPKVLEYILVGLSVKQDAQKIVEEVIYIT